jgi:Lon protease-like protein
MSDPRNENRIPLLSLSDVVFFPRTTLRLRMKTSRHDRLVQALLERDQADRRLGVVLARSADPAPGERRRAIFPGGTASQVLDVEARADGGSELYLEGEVRFVVHEEVGGDAYREALVEEVEEPWFDEKDAGVMAVRGEIVHVAERLSDELGDRFPLADDVVSALAAHASFEELVNRLASELDLPPVRKLDLLETALPERALQMLSVLKARLRVVDLLRPYRPLAARPHLN